MFRLLQQFLLNAPDYLLQVHSPQSIYQPFYIYHRTFQLSIYYSTTFAGNPTATALAGISLKTTASTPMKALTPRTDEPPLWQSYTTSYGSILS
jgi:hypothetical protein